MNILLAYGIDLYTTANYCANALRKLHTVVTCGPGKHNKSQDIPCQVNTDISEIIDRIDDTKKPDLIIYMDGNPNFFPGGIEDVSIPTVWYHIDVPYHFQWSRQIIPFFDFLFVAQKNCVEKCKEAGCSNVYYLPVGCVSEIHKKWDMEKVYDLCFIGTIDSTLHPQRVEMLNRLSNKFNIYIDQKYLDEMAQVFSKSKIVFNKSTINDLNMRVFEALSCGSLLITDRLYNNGLEDLFTDRKHLVIYDNYEHLEELVDYYLKHDEEREEIARQGREEVLARHTYKHRMKELLEIVIEKLNSGYKKKVIHYSPTVKSIIYAESYLNLGAYPEAILEYQRGISLMPRKTTSSIFRRYLKVCNLFFFLSIKFFQFMRFSKSIYLRCGKFAITKFTFLRKIYLRSHLKTVEKR